MKHSLILEPDAPLLVREVGEVLTAVLGLHPADARGRVRYCGGILVEGVDEDTGRSVHEGLRALGVPTRLVPLPRLPPAPRGFRAASLARVDDALIVRRPDTTSVVLLAPEVIAIHLHAIREQSGEAADRSATILGGPLSILADPGSPAAQGLSPRGRRLLERLREPESDGLELHLTIHAREPIGPVRVPRDPFDYSGLGRQKQAHSLDNFLLLVEEVLAVAPSALHRAQAETFLRSLDPGPIVRYKAEEVAAFDRWVHYLADAGCGRDEESAAPTSSPSDSRGDSTP